MQKLMRINVRMRVKNVLEVYQRLLYCFSQDLKCREIET
ncbi:hypothetical protein METHPM2_720020 [Pseudomonas sp. PM2]